MKTVNTYLVLVAVAVILLPFKGCGQVNDNNNPHSNKGVPNKGGNEMTETATFGAGCFWCVEAVFERLNGVLNVESGYSGGTIDNPTYEQVCSGKTGHAEVCRITYDSSLISFDELLEVFWKTHDPTTLNRQGSDVGTQYRSVIFTENQTQYDKAVYYKQRLEEEKVFSSPIVTEITPLTRYYPAEEYHQDYYNNNSRQGYCMFVIAPKIEKLKKVFREKLSDQYR